MLRCVGTYVVLLTIVGVYGCHSKKQVTTPTPAKAAAPLPTKSDAEHAASAALAMPLSEEKATTPAAAAKSTPVNSAVPSGSVSLMDAKPDETDGAATSGGQGSAAIVAEASKPEIAAKPAARVAILTPGGPLVMDVEIRVDGKPQHAALDKLIDDVLAAADAEHKRQPTWKALAANEEFLKKQNEKTPVPPRELKRWVEQFDINHDAQIQRDEAAVWLGRATGRTVRAFSLRSSRMYFSAGGASSRIWKLLDSDGDGQLSASELEHCAATLLTFDDDDDGAVTADEFETIYEQIRTDAERAATIGRSRTAFAALNLDGDFPNDRLEYLLTDLYAPQQLLQPASFPMLQKEFQSLDANQDDQFDQDEISGIRTMKPQLKVAVDFTTPAEGKPAGAPALKVAEAIPDLKRFAADAANRAVYGLGTTRLVLSADDLSSSAAAGMAADAAAVHLMVHDRCDPLFELLDENSDGRLGERDISTASKVLTQFDANRDGALESGELPYTMIVAFLRGERADADAFFRPQFKSTSRGSSNTPAWFERADFNADGDISRREFLGTSDQFKELDANGDGFVNGNEAAAANKGATEN